MATIANPALMTVEELEQNCCWALLNFALNVLVFSAIKFRSETVASKPRFALWRN